MTVTQIGNTGNAKSAIAEARAEIAQEQVRKGVEKLKIKLREQAAAQLVLDNITREIADLELKIEQGAA